MISWNNFRLSISANAKSLGILKLFDRKLQLNSAHLELIRQHPDPCGAHSLNLKKVTKLACNEVNARYKYMTFEGFQQYLNSSEINQACEPSTRLTPNQTFNGLSSTSEALLKFHQTFTNRDIQNVLATPK
jgi:hypothetical protein